MNFKYDPIILMTLIRLVYTRQELPKFEQYIFADHAPFITVENVYEDILLQILETEVSKGTQLTADQFWSDQFSRLMFQFSDQLGEGA